MSSILKIIIVDLLYGEQVPCRSLLFPRVSRIHARCLPPCYRAHWLFFFHFPRLMGFFAFCLQEASPFFFFFFWRWRFGREARYGISCFARGSGGPFLIFVFLGWWREDIVNGGAKLSSPVVEDWAEVEGARPPHIISFPVWFLVQSSFASCRMKVHIFCLPIVTLGQVEFLFTFLGNYHCTQCKSWCDEYWHQQLDS